jgi:hypothetical protein
VTHPLPLSGPIEPVTGSKAPAVDTDGALTLRTALRHSVELETRIAQDPSRFRILTGDRPTRPRG